MTALKPRWSRSLPIAMAYGPMHWELAGDIMLWFFTAVLLTAGVAIFRPGLLRRGHMSRGEVYYTALAYTLIWSSAAIAGLFLFGLVFLCILHVETSFWAFYELFYLVSIPLVFHVFPVLAVAAWIWGLYGWQRLGYAPNAIKLAALVTLAVTASALSYFGLEIACRWNQ
jgi:hypothetical protein